MTVRTKHGNAKRFPGPTSVLETLPIDEAPDGIPAEARTELPSDRGQGGRFAPGNTLAALGGRAKTGKSKLATKLGLERLPDGSHQKPYRASAETFRRTSNASIAANFGGGVCGPIPSSFVASAAIALGWSRYYLDLASTVAESDPVKAASFVDLGMKLAEQSTKHLRWAQELCAKEAEARSKKQPRRGWALPGVTT